MKNIGASVDAVPTQEVEEEVEEEEYHMMKNEMIFFLKEAPEYEMIFFLKEAPEYRISGVAEWGENSQGDIVREVDTYFLHVMTGQRCESAWGCLVGWSEPDEYATEKWETLCRRIEEYENIEQDMCYEKTIGV